MRRASANRPVNLREVLLQLRARDASVFPRAQDRLGWIDAPARPWEPLTLPSGCSQALLLGMGGSSLAAMVYAMWGTTGVGLPLRVLDSTVPDAVRAETARLVARDTVLVAVSKSGTTVETRALLAHFATQVPREHIVVATDANTPLAAQAASNGWGVVRTERDVGGRFSALATAGLLPAQLLGLNVDQLLAGARDERVVTEALALAEQLARASRVALSAPNLPTLGLWAEQLLAESSGKAGRGVLPLPSGVEGKREDKEVFSVTLDPRDLPDLGRTFYRWEIAVSLACVALGVNPFDEPDVASAKAFARALLGGKATDVPPLPDLPRVGQLQALLAKATRYSALLVFAAPTRRNAELLERARRHMADATKLPAVAAFGPRYLHSTGQLHKGGPAGGSFLVVVCEEGPDIPISGQDYSFGALTLAQARGDVRALEEAGRAVLGVHLRAGELPILVDRLGAA